MGGHGALLGSGPDPRGRTRAGRVAWRWHGRDCGRSHVELGRISRNSVWRHGLAIATVALAVATAADGHERDPMQEVTDAPLWRKEADTLLSSETQHSSIYLTTSAFDALYSDVRRHPGWEYRGSTVPNIHEYLVGDRSPPSIWALPTSTRLGP